MCDDHIAVLIPCDPGTASDSGDSRVGLDARTLCNKNIGILQTRHGTVECSVTLDATPAGDNQGLFSMLAHHFTKSREGTCPKNKMGGIVKFKVHEKSPLFGLLIVFEAQ
jgi:hypothetical protein